ncbi:class I SAM-dependent methyltransferase [Sulfurimonas sp. MAG313]|nr:class I SAM-dependent methyltransferase [Sulfurimonas sp. MAG313]MDF1881182.1 class I SAM-dependent methyltransferase [Sulfurimonas sp. MAG313]
MSRIDNETFYTAAIKKHGQDSKGVHWNSLHSQYTRFKVLLSFIQEENFSLVDAGCGFGDLYFYMQDENVPFSSYKGLDLCASMVNIAQEKTKQEILECNICTDTLPQADYYICSGAMNILTRFDTFLFIQNCYKASIKGFVFNLLMGEDDSLVYNHFYPKELQNLFDKLGAEVSVKKGYLKHDFTVFLKKPQGEV